MTARWLSTSSATVVFPRNGIGGATAQRGNASTGADTTYTASTGVDANAAIPGAGTAAGDYVFTADGFWGIVRAYAGAAGNTVVTVDRWRSVTDGAQGTPAATNAFTIHSGCEVATLSSGKSRPTRLIYVGGAGAATVTVCDGAGANLLPPFVFAANALPCSIDLGTFMEGLGPISAPAGLKTSANSAILVYER